LLCFFGVFCLCINQSKISRYKNLNIYCNPQYSKIKEAIFLKNILFLKKFFLFFSFLFIFYFFFSSFSFFKFLFLFLDLNYHNLFGRKASPSADIAKGLNIWEGTNITNCFIFCLNNSPHFFIPKELIVV
jgi:hypothetical protein